MIFTPVCDDGLVVAGETCDAGINEGCTSTCNGIDNGWHCTGGDTTTATICVEQCGDGYITTNEQCEDGNTNNLDGCDSTCK